ncbi:transforming acidic coiled-coil-containing protein 2 isoform X2 [Bombina bombina]|uniref:transforming acidic coiled-coil-containing protein 2 isoform X2 n=1 Tax=Bombina bombina TaxID=8345 RepID=UPI00235A9FBB|nr:transforming acidic coiled-coil-containing protein 2 isoform X2 [Bombina bombina]XP_053548608.1 transforming acidic coiled-coil-containing protein 2 isoform X2 [Bombina bombina]
MGNDNSHQSENQKATSGPQISPQGASAKDKQQEPSADPVPILVPQWDSDIRGREQYREGAEGDVNTAAVVYPEDPSVPAANSGAYQLGDIAFRSVWEEGQLLPTLPLPDPNIAALEYQESGSSAHTGTVRTSSTEESQEGSAALDELGLSGILREWGQHVLPEKIHVEVDKKKENLQSLKPSFDETELQFSDLSNIQQKIKSVTSPGISDTEDIKTVASDSTETDANHKNDSKEQGRLSSQLTAQPSELVSEFSQLCSRNSVPSQPLALLDNPENTSNQAKGDSRNSITSQQGLGSFTETETLLTDGGNNQSDIKSSLIWVYSTDGSSDRNSANRSTANKLTPEAYPYRTDTPFVSPVASLMVLQSSGGPDTFSNKPITPLANLQSVQQGEVAENLHQEHLDEFDSHHFAKIQPQVTDTVQFMPNAEKCRDNTQTDLAEKKTVNDNAHSGSQNQEVIIHHESMTDSTDLPITIKPENESNLEIDTEVVEDMAFSVGQGTTSQQSLKMREEDKTPTVISCNVSSMMLNTDLEQRLGSTEVTEEKVVNKTKLSSLQHQSEKEKNATEAHYKEGYTADISYYTQKSPIGTMEISSCEKKAVKNDNETTYLSVSETLNESSYSTATQFDSITIEPGQSVNREYVESKQSSIVDVVIAQANIMPHLPDNVLDVSSMDRVYLEHQEDTKSQVLMEKINTVVNQDIYLKSTNQKQASDSHIGLQLSILPDMGGLNLKPGDNAEESSNSQPDKNIFPSTTVIDLKVHEEENTNTKFARTQELKECTQLALNQQEKVSIEDTPYLTPDKLPSNEMLPEVQKHPINDTYGSQLVVSKMDTCNKTEDNGLQKKITLINSCTESIRPGKTELLAQRKDQSSDFFPQSYDSEPQVTTSQCSPLLEVHKKDFVNKLHHYEMGVGKVPEDPTSNLLQRGVSLAENSTDSGKEKSDLCVTSQTNEQNESSKATWSGEAATKEEITTLKLTTEQQTACNLTVDGLSLHPSNALASTVVTELLNHGDVSQDKSEDSNMVPQTENLELKELSHISSAKIAEQSSGEDAMLIIQAEELENKKGVLSDMQVLLIENTAKHRVKDILRPDVSGDNKHKKESAQEENKSQTLNNISTSIGPLKTVHTEINKKKLNDQENAQDISFGDCTVMLPLSQNKKQKTGTEQCFIPQYDSNLEPQIDSAEKLEESLDILKQKVDQEMHSQWKHPEGVCEALSKVNPAYSLEEHDTLQDNKGKIVDYEEQSCILMDTITISDTNFSKQPLTDEPDMISGTIGLKISNVTNTLLPQLASPQEVGSSVKQPMHFTPEILETKNAPQALSKTSEKISDTKALEFGSNKLDILTEILNPSPQVREKSEISAGLYIPQKETAIICDEPYSTISETEMFSCTLINTPSETDILCEKLGLSLSKRDKLIDKPVTDTKNVTFSETNRLNNKPGFKPLYTDLHSDKQDIKPFETDIITDKPYLKPLETDVVPDKQDIKPSETDILTDKPDVKPLETDIVTDKLYLKPLETDIVADKPDLKPSETDILTELGIKPSAADILLFKPDLKPLEIVIITDQPDVKPSETDKLTGKTDIKPLETDIVTDNADLKPSQIDILTRKQTLKPSGTDIVTEKPGLISTDKPGLISSETKVTVEDIVIDKPGLKPSETNIVTEKSGHTPSVTDLVTDKLIMKPSETDKINDKPDLKPSVTDVDTDSHGVTLSETDIVIDKPCFTPSETDIMTEKQSLKSSVKDIVTAKSVLLPSEKDLVTDKSGFKPLETDLVTDKQCLKHSDTDLISDKPRIKFSETNLITDKPGLNSSVIDIFTDTLCLKTSETDLVIDKSTLKLSETDLATDKPDIKPLATDLVTDKADLIPLATYLVTDKAELKYLITDLVIDKPDLNPSETALISDKPGLKPCQTNLVTNKLRPSATDTFTDTLGLKHSAIDVTEKPGFKPLKIAIDTDKPVIKSSESDLVTDKPDFKPSATDVVTKKTELKPSATDSVTDKPDLKSSETNLVTDKLSPSATDIFTETLGLKPSAIDVVTEKPGFKPSATEHVTDKPDLKPSEADLGTDKPDLKPSETDLGTDKPDLKPSETDLVIDKPDLKPSETDLVIDKPDLKPSETDLVTDKVELTSLITDLVTDKPDLKPSETDLVTDKPDLKSSETDLVTDKPDLKPSETDLVTDKAELKSLITDLVTDKSDLKPSETDLVTDKRVIKSSETDLVTDKPDFKHSAIDLVTKKTELKPSATDHVTDKPDLKPLDTDLVTDKPDLKPSETDIVTDKQVIKSSETDLVTDKPDFKHSATVLVTKTPNLRPSETDLVIDKPDLKPSETDLVTDNSAFKPSVVGVFTDKADLKPATTDTLPKISNLSTSEVLPEFSISHVRGNQCEDFNPTVNLQSDNNSLPDSKFTAGELVLAPKDTKRLSEKFAPSFLETIMTQKVKQDPYGDLDTRFRITSCSSEEQVFAANSLEHISEGNVLGHVPFKPFSEIEKPNSEAAARSPVIRSPTFPTSDSYSFTQKLRSVLHSDRVLPRKSTPTTPEPLVLPSSSLLSGDIGTTERSSDSEEAFETPESTTPVKSAPPVPIPSVSEVQEQQPQQQEPPHQEEETSQPPSLPEETGSGSILDNVSTADETVTDNVHDSPFRAPSRSFSIVFDEDKPIASSGTYNLDFASVEQTETNSSSSEAAARTRRKSTDSVPVSRNTLSRSLSLQAGDFQFEDGIASHGGSDSACSTLRRTKKPRPASLKKKQSAKKQSECPASTDIQQVSSGESQQADTDKKVQEQSVESSAVPQTDAELPVAEAQPILPCSSIALSSATPEDSIGSVSVSEPPVPCSSEDSGKASPLLTAQQAPEVTPSDTGGPEISGVIGQAVRLEFDYSEEAREGQPPSRKGKKPSGKMPLRKPKPKKAVEKPDAPPGSQSPIPVESNEIPIGRGSYTYNMDKWDDPNFNPFSSSGKMVDPSVASQETSEQIKPLRSESPARTPASFEIPTNNTEHSTADGNKPAKKKKTPLKTDTFRVKKSPKRSPVNENGSEELTILPSPDVPPVINSEDHATDEEKLASSVSSQKWTCMAVDLEPEKQDYPQPSDLTNFVNENKFLASTNEIEYGNSYNIEYMEKTGSCSPLREMPQTQSLYLMFEESPDSPEKTLTKMTETSGPGTGTNFEGMESTLCSQLPMSPPVLKDTVRQPLERPRQRDGEPLCGSGKMELSTPEDVYVAAETLLSRISHQAALCDQLNYLEPDLAEKNPQAFAQKLQEELEFAAMRIEALKLASHISQSLQCPVHTECDGLDSSDVSLAHNSLYSRTVAMDTASAGLLLPYQQSDLDTALQLAREEISAKEQEVTEWKKKYEDSRCEVVEMRKIVAEYETTIAQMIEDEQREKSVSHHTVQQLILEKEQALSDLNSVEKSLADLFRRYEKMKDVLEGFRKNEEVLKKCAQEYLARVKKEEQRYHALKIHAEEKLDRANADIAQVRSKSQQEQAAYQASLRKEQLRVDALERTLEQKNREIEELTKICDELISKMGRS